jgi:hypothetical protein
MPKNRYPSLASLTGFKINKSSLGAAFIFCGFGPDGIDFHLGRKPFI